MGTVAGAEVGPMVLDQVGIQAAEVEVGEILGEAMEAILALEEVRTRV